MASSGIVVGVAPRFTQCCTRCDMPVWIERDGKVAVYGWIYANAKIRGDGGDYLVRWCDPALKRYEDMLTSLSRGMLATTKRYGQAEGQECWIFGFLDKGRRCPVVAVAGEQERLLGMPLAGGGFRKQYCVLAWGFDGGEIRLRKRNDGIFEPLKEVLREIQRTGKTAGPGDWETGAGDDFVLCSGQQAMEDSIGPERNLGVACPHMACNIVNSGPEDDKLWETSLGSKPQRPVMTGILGVEEAKRMLDFFPDGVVTVIGDIKPQYYSPQKEKSVSGNITGNGVKTESRSKAVYGIRSESGSKAGNGVKAESGNGIGNKVKAESGNKTENGMKAESGDGTGNRAKAASGSKAGNRIKAANRSRTGNGVREEKGNGAGTGDGTGRVCVGPDGVVIMPGNWHGAGYSTASRSCYGQKAESGMGSVSDREECGKQEKAGNREKAGNEETANAVKEISKQAAKRQILDKEKEEKERRKIIECAKRCREALDKKTVEDILDAVRRMGLKDGFSQQMRFFGCMYLWRSIYLGQGAVKSRTEISYFLEAWRQRVKNKNGAFQANKIMADEVMALMGRRR